MKKCSKCKNEKDFNLFLKCQNNKTGFRSQCKECQKKQREKSKERIKQNKLKFKEKNPDYDKNYSFQNKEKIKENKKLYSIKNKNIIAEKKKIYAEKVKEKTKEYNKKWQTENKLNLIEYRREYRNKRKKEDILYKIKLDIRKLLHSSFTRNQKGFKKKSKTKEILGCDILFFKNYIKSKFKEGMSFDNHGEWEYDHIIPLSIAVTEEDIVKLNHYTNFQPLWKKENRQKSNKIIS